jgi:hypothetical protein
MCLAENRLDHIGDGFLGKVWPTHSIPVFEY